MVRQSKTRESQGRSPVIESARGHLALSSPTTLRVQGSPERALESDHWSRIIRDSHLAMPFDGTLLNEAQASFERVQPAEETDTPRLFSQMLHCPLRKT